MLAHIKLRPGREKAHQPPTKRSLPVQEEPRRFSNEVMEVRGQQQSTAHDSSELLDDVITEVALMRSQYGCPF